MTVQEQEIIENCFNKMEMIKTSLDRVEKKQSENEKRVFDADIQTEKNKYETNKLIEEVLKIKNDQ